MDVQGTLQNFFGPTWPAVWTLTKIVAIVVPLMLCVAYLTLAERKVIGWMQVRLGPNRVTFFGIPWLGGWAQPIADGLGGGRYRLKNAFTMEGDWKLDVHATIAGKEHIATFDQPVTLQQ